MHQVCTWVRGRGRGAQNELQWDSFAILPKSRVRTCVSRNRKKKKKVSKFISLRTDAMGTQDDYHKKKRVFHITITTERIDDTSPRSIPWEEQGDWCRWEHPLNQYTEYIFAILDFPKSLRCSPTPVVHSRPTSCLERAVL